MKQKQNHKYRELVAARGGGVGWWAKCVKESGGYRLPIMEWINKSLDKRGKYRKNDHMHANVSSAPLDKLHLKIQVTFPWFLEHLLGVSLWVEGLWDTLGRVLASGDTFLWEKREAIWQQFANLSRLQNHLEGSLKQTVTKMTLKAHRNFACIVFRWNYYICKKRNNVIRAPSHEINLAVLSTIG